MSLSAATIVLVKILLKILSAKMSNTINNKELIEIKALLGMLSQKFSRLMTPENKPSRKGGLTPEQKLKAIKHRNKIVFKNK